MSYKLRNVFLSILGARESKIKLPADADLVAGEGSLPGSQVASLRVLTWWKGA